MTAAAASTVSEDRSFFGHPRGLSTLFFTEMWERFSYYGMRAFLVLFMVAPIEAGGLGFADARAGVIYGTYTAMVYMLSVPGGWIADRFIGQQRAVLIGGILIMSGHIALALPTMATFYLGLALVALGTGLLKPNISTIVGQLYNKEDKRRDAGFTIFYMGINLGAFVAPLVCGSYLAESEGFREMLKGMGIAPGTAWHFAFGAAAVGMFLGLVQYFFGRKYLGNAGLSAVPPRDAEEASRNKMILGAVLTVFVLIPVIVAIMGATGAIELTPEVVGKAFDIILPVTAILVLGGLYFFATENADEKRRMIVVTILFFAAAIFWGCFEQAGSTLTLFASRHTERSIFGIEFGATAFQSLNAILVVLLAPVFAALWIALAKRNQEPGMVTKFGFGMVGVGSGFLVMLPAAAIVMGGGLAGPHWLALLYLLHTCAELCLSPVGLSSMSKLAPARIGGLIMGVWFLAASVGNYLAGRAVGFTENMEMDDRFLFMASIPIAFGVLLFVIAKPVQRMLARSDGGGSASGH